MRDTGSYDFRDNVPNMQALSQTLPARVFGLRVRVWVCAQISGVEYVPRAWGFRGIAVKGSIPEFPTKRDIMGRNIRQDHHLTWFNRQKALHG